MSKLLKKIEMFATENDTPHWIVAVSGLAGKFDNEAEATRVYNLIDNIEESPFGSCWLISPNYKPEFKDKRNLTKISEVELIDIEAYIKNAYIKREHAHNKSHTLDVQQDSDYKYLRNLDDDLDALNTTGDFD